MSALVEQQRQNAYARAHEVGIPGVLTNCLKAGMTLKEARAIVEEAKDKRNPWQFTNKCIAIWRAKRELG